MSVKAVGIGLVEALLANLLKLQTAHHRVEEDLQEVEMVPVGLLHHLDPLNSDCVVHTVVLGSVNWQFSHFLEREYAETVVDKKLQFLFDLVPTFLKHLLAESSGVVRDLGLKLDGVLVNTLDVVRVEVDREVVGVKLERLAFGVSCTLGFLGEEGRCSFCGYHSCSRLGLSWEKLGLVGFGLC